jgi:RNA polymerase sigma-70 factor (ECF subfamily)
MASAGGLDSRRSGCDGPDFGRRVRRGDPVNEVSDLSLIQQLQGGDAAALEMLMERHAGRAYRVAFGITRNSADAEEVVQDAFLTLYQKADAFEGRAALSTWLYRIVTNAALMKRRGRRHAVEVSLEAQLPTFREDGSRAGEMRVLMADWSQNPEAHLLSRETQTILQGAIESLPDAHRAVLLLRDVEGLSNDEVAEIVGESVAAVKSRLHRARMAVREQLAGHLGPHDRGGWLRDWRKKLGLWKG